MTTDELRSKYGKPVHFNCKDGDEAFTDEYVLWLENKIIELCDEDVTRVRFHVKKYKPKFIDHGSDE